MDIEETLRVIDNLVEFADKLELSIDKNEVTIRGCRQLVIKDVQKKLEKREYEPEEMVRMFHMKASFIRFLYHSGERLI